MKTLALCSESTGKANLAVLSVGIAEEATEKAKACSLPVTPCMELPGEACMSDIAQSSRVCKKERSATNKVVVGGVYILE